MRLFYNTLTLSLTAIFTFCFLSLSAAGEKKLSSKTEIKPADQKTSEQYKAEFPDISQEDLVKAIEAKSVVIVDANGSESYKTGHIPGAIHYKSETFKQNLPEDKNTLFVAYCGGPACEAWCKAADELKSLGYTNIKHFSGGIKGWKKAGLETAKPKKES